MDNEQGVAERGTHHSLSVTSLEEPSDNLRDCCRDKVLVRTSVQHFDPAWMADGQVEKASADAFVKPSGLAVHSVQRDPVLSSAPCESGRNGKIEEERQVRRQPLRGKAVQAEQSLDVQPAPIALVGEGGVHKPIAQYHGAFTKRGSMT